MKTNKFILTIAFFIASLSIGMAQTVVNSLAEFQAAVQNSNQTIEFTAGTYYLEDLPSASRVINCSGSNNIIDMTEVLIRTRVGTIREVYFIISGNDNTLRNGAIEDFYQSGLEEVTDFSAYNNDRTNLAYGLRGDPVMSITGNRNLVVGLEMTVKGSFPYGYGSQYGIGAVNTFGLNKRCGILITGKDGGGIGNTLDGITMHHYAFGHGIFMQTGATETTIKNCYIEGRMRNSDDMYNDTETYDLPYRTDYKFPSGDDWRTLPFAESYDIPRGDNSVVYPLSEDGIRSYNNTGSVTVENCTVKQMRGGIRLYLASSATVKNSTAIDCGSGGTNFNLPTGATVTGSSGNFTYTTLSDFRLSRSRMNIEMTIIPSPNAIGPHNIADILGNDHNIVFHRTAGPLDSDEERVIVVSGNNSTIVNETEYTIVLESGTSGNKITSCGPVIDNGNNTVTLNDCTFDLGTPTCSNTPALIEAECFDDSFEIIDEGENIGSIRNGYWAKYSDLDLTEMNAVEVTASSAGLGGTIEFRLDAVDGELISSVDVAITGGWTNWETFSANITRVTGTHDIYTVFKGANGWLYNIDQFSFSEEVVCDIFPSNIEAECFDDMLGVQTENCSEGTLNVGYIQNGDWIKYDALDLTGMNSIKARVSGKTTGSTIQVRLGSETGTLIGTLEVSNTGGNQTWVTDSINLSETVLGTQDVYLVFKGGTGYLFNINYFGFSEDEILVTGVDDFETTDFEIFPNPFDKTIIVQMNSNQDSQIEILNALGQVVASQNANTSEITLDLNHVNNGLYFVKITMDNQVITREILKK